MKHKFLIGCALLMTFMFCSCNSMMDYDLNNVKKADEQKKYNNKSRISRDPWDTIPSPMNWVADMEGKGPYKPLNPIYFYVGEDPPYKIANEYNSYVYFDLHAFPTEGHDYPHLGANYLLQIEWKWEGSEHWSYINTPMGDGLVNMIYNDQPEDISAYAFPYLADTRRIQVRMRTIHRDFLKSAPNPDADGELRYLYDLNLVSPWSADSRGGLMGLYSNPWGYGQPQSEQSGNGGSDDDQSDSHILVTVHFPRLSGYTLSYEISNLSGGYNEKYTKDSPSTTGLNRYRMTGVGFDGGTIQVFVKCRNDATGDITYSERTEYYSLGEKTLDIFFSEIDFLY